MLDGVGGTQPTQAVPNRLRVHTHRLLIPGYENNNTNTKNNTTTTLSAIDAGFEKQARDCRVQSDQGDGLGGQRSADTQTRNRHGHGHVSSVLGNDVTDQHLNTSHSTTSTTHKMYVSEENKR
jgi:hypothetical protein